MAVSFQTQATRQLAPAYSTQIKAVKSQIPSIQNKYNTLISGLQGQQQSANLNAFEDASSRGMLRSTVPVDAQQAIAQGVLAKQGELSGQMGQEIGAVRSQIADIGVRRATSIADLVNALRDRALQESQFKQQTALANRQFSLDQALLNRGY
jgi:hypothetical protein